MKLLKTFLNYAPNVFVQRKNYKRGDGAYLWGCINNKAVRHTVVGKLITEFRYVLLEIYWETEDYHTDTNNGRASSL
jgi:hypothetical protein